MNYNELTGNALYKAVREWLDNNPGKNIGDFTKETGYTGPELQVKDKKTGRIGLRTRSTDVERAARIASQDQEYLDTLINEYGYSEADAKAKLKKAKTKVKNLRSQVAKLNKQFGKGSFTVGHLTAVAEGGGDFNRNVRLEIGKSVDGKRGNFSRAAVDELPTNIKAVLGIPSSGREAAIMDHEGLFDLELTPQDRQRIFQNPTAEFADEVIENRLTNKSKQTRLIDDFTPAQRRALNAAPNLPAKEKLVRQFRNLPVLGVAVGGGIAATQLMQGKPAAAAETLLDTAVSEIPIVDVVLEPASTADATLKGRTDPKAYAAQYKKERQKAKQEQSNFITNTLKLISDAI
jgi:hypothetical protein